ncbi:MAG: type II toxin-antitoxin system Phd/YefM family antitoxin [Gemmatimonadota bacterium]|nr:type II toxin-antitoxin system Phd/YefM family antitoxin [Gemmatimonadota bacterium]
MYSVDVNEAQTELSALLARVDAGEDVVITRHGKPVARVVPYGSHRGVRRFGSLKGRLMVDDRFFDPLPEAEMAAWQS